MSEALSLALSTFWPTSCPLSRVPSPPSPAHPASNLQREVPRVRDLPGQHLPHDNGKGEDIRGTALSTVTEHLRGQPPRVGCTAVHGGLAVACGQCGDRCSGCM